MELKLIDRIKYIEEGIESTNIEIIENPRESLRLAYEVVRSAKEEVLRMYPSINAFHRQVRVGAMRLFKEVLERGIKVRILIPTDEEQIRQIINEVTSELPHIDIRSIDKSLQSHIGIIVVDRKQSLIVESKIILKTIIMMEQDWLHILIASQLLYRMPLYLKFCGSKPNYMNNQRLITRCKKSL